MFEYKVESAASEARLNELGAEGWELVSCDGLRCYLRRARGMKLDPPASPEAVTRMNPESAALPGREHFGKKNRR